MSGTGFPPPIHSEGWRFIPIFAIVTLLLFWAWQPLGWLGVLLTIWCVAFFRDPNRVTLLPDPHAIVSPADGLIIAVTPSPPPPELGMGNEPMLRISVFMSVFDVHVNRLPAAGRIERLAYVAGRFINASFDKASELNERMAVRMSLTGGGELAFVQIAGLVARRIRCDLHEGEQVEAGRRFGLIRFGSRADVYLPEGFDAMVAVGQRAVGGETILAMPSAAADLAVSPLADSELAHGESSPSKPARRRPKPIEPPIEPIE